MYVRYHGYGTILTEVCMVFIDFQNDPILEYGTVPYHYCVILVPNQNNIHFSQHYPSSFYISQEVDQKDKYQG